MKIIRLHTRINQNVVPRRSIIQFFLLEKGEQSNAQLGDSIESARPASGVTILQLDDVHEFVHESAKIIQRQIGTEKAGLKIFSHSRQSHVTGLGGDIDHAEGGVKKHRK